MLVQIIPDSSFTREILSIFFITALCAMASHISDGDGVFGLEKRVHQSHKRTFDMFYATQRLQPPEFPEAQRVRVASRVMDDYKQLAMPETVKPPASVAAASRASRSATGAVALLSAGGPAPLLLTDALSSRSSARAPGGVSASHVGTAVFSDAGRPANENSAMVVGGTMGAVRDVVNAFATRSAPAGLDASDDASRNAYAAVEVLTERAQAKSRAIIARRQPAAVPVPKWHAPWKLMRVISGHLGWVRAIAVEPGNEWFVTGAADRLIKVWDLASGTLKVTLTGHINAVRGLAVSSRHPYMFSAGEDKQVFCWDLEYNKVIRKYTGHLSGVYSLALHPTLDVVLTGGRDSVCRVWDMRTKTQVHVLGGHENSITSILANGSEPQVITGSQDNTIRTWDLAAGKVRSVLTHHKKGVRGMASHPTEWAFVSGAADNLKKWALPDSTFIQNFSGHNSIVNSLALNADDVLVSCGDDGTMNFWDYTTGYRFQSTITRPQPGSLDSENGIFASTFDATGLRLITCEADKSIKVWREDSEASEESHPVDMAAWTAHAREHKIF